MTGTRFPVRVVSTLAVLGMLFAPVHAVAQVAVGTLVGSVRDDSGGGVPGATVTATETRTNISSHGRLQRGRQLLLQQPGAWRVPRRGRARRLQEILARGRRGQRQHDDPRGHLLAVGQLEESVIVTGEAPMLQTDRTDTGRIIESTQITQMPLGFNRNFQALLITVPGASRPFRPHSEFYNSQDSLSSNINGQGRQSNNVQLEGADNSDNGGNLAFMIPSAEAIETVAVTTSNYDAEFGRAGGAVTNVTLKTGTNQFRGSIFSFGNTEATVARNPFSQLAPADAQVHAGRLYAGRPDQAEQALLLRRLRAHQRRQRPADARPRAGGRVQERRLQRGADAHLRPAHGQCRRHAAARSSRTIRFRRTASARSRASCIANIPLPNIPGAAVGAINFEQPYVREKRTNQGDVKVTYQVAANDLVNVRYSRRTRRTLDPATFGIYGGLKPFAGHGHQSHTKRRRDVQPRLVRDAGAGGALRPYASPQRGDRRRLRADDLRGSWHQGHQPAITPNFTSGITTINVGGYNDYLIGFETSLPWDREESTTTVSTTATKIWGNHTIKIGGDLRTNRHLLDQVAHPRASWQFRGAQTALDHRQRRGKRLRQFAGVVHAGRAAVRRTRPGERGRFTAAARTRASTPTFTTSGRSGRISRWISACVTRCTRPSSDTRRRADR